MDGDGLCSFLSLDVMNESVTSDLNLIYVIDIMK